MSRSEITGSIGDDGVLLIDLGAMPMESLIEILPDINDSGVLRRPLPLDFDRQGVVVANFCIVDGPDETNLYGDTVGGPVNDLLVHLVDPAVAAVVGVAANAAWDSLRGKLKRRGLNASPLVDRRE